MSHALAYARGKLLSATFAEEFTLLFMLQSHKRAIAAIKAAQQQVEKAIRERDKAKEKLRRAQARLAQAKEQLRKSQEQLER